MEQKEQLGDFIGGGNLFLDLALRIDRRHLKTVLEAAKHLVALQFEIPGQLEYGLPHRDQFLDHSRHSTASDYLPQLIIFAYVLGATRRTLPPPDDRLLDYYLYVADLQRKELQSIAAAYAEANEPKRSSPHRTFDPIIQRTR